MTYFLLFFEFLKVGLFSFGGGYATIPFLHHMAQNYSWFSFSDIGRMVAISSITPGPIGMNMATFAGFKAGGILGSALATAAIMLPSFFFVIIISKALNKYHQMPCVCSVLWALRPAAMGLMAAVCVELLKESIFVQNAKMSFNSLDIFAVCLLAFFFVLSFKLKKNPILYISLGAILGILIGFTK